MNLPTIIRRGVLLDASRSTAGSIVILMFAVALIFASPSRADDAPRRQEMCQAFRTYLSTQVQRVLEFVRETEGPDGVARVRRAGTDRFEIRSFSTPQCRRFNGMPNQVCSFSVRVATVKGIIRRTVTGYFVARGYGHLVFFPQAEPEHVAGSTILAVPSC